MRIATFLLLAWIFSSCSSVTSLRESQLEPGYYYFDQADQKRVKVRSYIDVVSDTLVVVPDGGARLGLTDGQKFHKHGLDIDAMTVLFKFRPSTSGFPNQLNADFNGNMFVGYRNDYYKTQVRETPTRVVKMLRHRAITVGGFAGIGTSFVSPWTTNYQTTDEYSGFIVSRGIAAMMGIRDLTVGIGVGWDHLVDRDQNIWIYQDKAWYGLTLSLNLN